MVSYYQEIPSAKVKVAERTETTKEATAAAKVREVVQAKEVAQFANVTVTHCLANYLGSRASRGRFQGKIVNKIKKTSQNKNKKLKINKNSCLFA